MSGIGDALSGIGSDIGSGLSSLFGGGGSGGGMDFGSMMGNMMSQMFGGGSSGASSSPTSTAAAVTQATDPTGSIGATQAITGGQNQQNQQPQNQQQGQNQNQNANKTADDFKKAMQALLQKRQSGAAGGNPYQTGGGGSNDPRTGYSVTGQPAPDPARRADEAGNDNTPPPNFPTIDPTSSTMAGLRTDAPANTGGQPIAPAANDNAAPQNFGDYLNNLRAGGGPGPVPGGAGGAPPTPPSGGGGGLGGLGPIGNFIARNAPGSIGELAGRMMGPLGVYLGNTEPADTGELKPGQPGYGKESALRPPGSQPPAPDPGSAQAKPAAKLPSDPIGKVPTKEGYEEWLKKQGVKPADAKKIADKAKLPTKKEADKLPTKTPLPTHKGPPPETPTGQTGHGRIMRDVSGMSTGVPQGLGELAKLALPLMMMAMGGMGGGGGIGFGGRHGGFRGGRGFGGFRGGGHMGGFGGGRGMYHHPTFGWQAHNFHPGGQWRGPMGMGGRMGGGMPFGPRQMQPFSYGGGGDGMDMNNPAIQSILQALGIDTGQGGQRGAGFGRDQSGGAFNPPTAANTPTSNKIPGVSANDVDSYVRNAMTQNGVDPDTASRIVAGESSYGQNYTNPRDTNGYPSYGPFQLNMAPGAMGDKFMRETGLNPADPSTWKQQVDWVAKQIRNTGWQPWATTAGKLGIGQWAGINRNFQPGRTATGGKNTANPNGNPADANPYASAPTPTQLGPESGGDTAVAAQ